MITFESGMDIRCREAKEPTVARFRVSAGDYQFVVIGTPYGYLRTMGGDVRTWRSYSGARRAALAEKEATVKALAKLNGETNDP